MAIKGINELQTRGEKFFSDSEYEQYRHMKKFNTVLWSYSAEVDFLVDEVFKEVLNSKLIRYRTQQGQYKDTLKTILCNAIESVMTSRHQITVSLNKNEYTSIPSRYNPIGITSRVFINLIEWLATNDFINLYKAPKGSSVDVRSVFTVTRKLRELIHGFEIKLINITNHKGSEPIELKRAKKLVDYEDNSSTLKDRALLKEYENLLNSSIIKIDGKLNTERVIVKRKYTEQLNKHGRVYCGSWQNCKSDLRSSITIDNKETVEVDIVNCSLRMVLHLSKVNMKGDLYSIKDYPRELVKDTINMMFNISNVKSTKQGIDRTSKALKNKYRDINVNFIKRLVEDCLSHYNSIAETWFFQGRGLDLQYLDSCICLKIIEEFTKDKEVVLTVHDSFIVKKELEKRLRNSIIRHYEEVIGEKPILR